MLFCRSQREFILDVHGCEVGMCVSGVNQLCITIFNLDVSSPRTVLITLIGYRNNLFCIICLFNSALKRQQCFCRSFTPIILFASSDVSSVRQLLLFTVFAVLQLLHSLHSLHSTHSLLFRCIHKFALRCCFAGRVSGLVSFRTLIYSLKVSCI